MVTVLYLLVIRLSMFQLVNCLETNMLKNGVNLILGDFIYIVIHLWESGLAQC